MPPAGARLWLFRICRTRPRLLPPAVAPRIAPSPAPCRPFTRPAPLLKNKHKHREPPDDDAAAVESDAQGESPGPDPLDTTELRAGIDEALERLRDRLAGLRAGGRFDPALVEELRVAVGRKPPAAARLADVAQVIPRRGRSLAVIVGQEEHVKPVINAIAASPHSLNPQRSPRSPLELDVPLPPSTRESRRDDVAALGRVEEGAHHGVRKARAAHQKGLRAAKLARAVRPDELAQAQKAMERLVQEGNEEARELVRAARKAMEGQSQS